MSSLADSPLFIEAHGRFHTANVADYQSGLQQEESESFQVEAYYTVRGQLNTQEVRYARRHAKMTAMAELALREEQGTLATEVTRSKFDQLGEDLLRDLFTDAWRQEFSEKDGMRTYKVNDLRKALLGMNLGTSKVDTASTKGNHRAYRKEST